MKRHAWKFICLCLSLLLTAGLISCSMYGQRKVADEAYLNVRTQIMSERRPQGSEDMTVYTAMIDIDAGDHVKTLVCLADGTTHLYLSTGEAYTDLHLDDPELAAASQALLEGLGDRLDHTMWLSKTDLALPQTNRDLIYLRSDQGIHSVTLIPARIAESPDEIQEIYGLYRAVYQAVASKIAP